MMRIDSSKFHFFGMLVVILSTAGSFPLRAGTPAATSPSSNTDREAEVEKRVEEMLGRLTPDEKLKLLGGMDNFYTQPIERVGLPKFRMSDGPCGARCAGPSTAYTAGVCLAAAWDRELAEQVGRSMGRDCRARGIHILLAPGMDLYRAPMCGRNFEYLGEDPVLSGFTAGAFVRGVQSQQVAATVKHFAVNDQEHDRVNLSSDVDERTLRELHLRSFQIAIREGDPMCVMNSYNPINGVHATQNGWLNNDILKNEFGFRGLLMSDWSSCHDTLGMANGGLDLEMPAAKFYTSEKLKPLIDSGKVSMATIDEKVRRQLRIAVKMGWLDRPQNDPSIPLDDPAAVAANTAEARGGITLLKNDENLLPLDPAEAKHIVVLGPNTDHPVTGGGGSSYVHYFHAVGVSDALAAAAVAAVANPAQVQHITWEAAEGRPAGGEIDLAAIRAADAVLICVGFDDPGCFQASHGSANEREEADRSYNLPEGQPALINAIAKLNPRTVVVLNSGGSVETASWIKNAKALLHSYYPGSAGNAALGEIILGRTNPSGHLPFTWEKRWEDSAAFGNYPDRGHERSNTYKEGILLGYRWFDAKNIEPLFPFGFGLSYTSFALSDFVVSKGDEAGLGVSVQVRNTGKRDGAAVVQVYAAPAEIDLPHAPRELKTFGKIFLHSGETKTLSMHVMLADLAMWDPAAKKWRQASGMYQFQAGLNSRELPVNASLGI